MTIKAIASRPVRAVYDRTLRPILPRKWGLSQGDITVRRPRLLDVTDQYPRDESAESDQLRGLVKPGDHVLIIGGGWGVTTVVASRAAGRDGRVTVYEAVPEMADRVRETVAHNYSPAPVTVHEAAVGSVTDASREQYGAARDIVGVDELPEADVWQLDCEGAEAEILGAASLPDRLIVEVHPDRTREHEVVRGLPRPFAEVEKRVNAPQWIAVVDQR